MRTWRGTGKKSITSFRFWISFPVVLISSVDGLRRAQDVRDRGRSRVKAYVSKVSTSAMNQALQRIVRAHAAPLSQGKPVKFYYGTQTGRAADLYFVCQFAAGCSRELSAVPDSPVARTPGARVRANSAKFASSARGAKKEKERIEFGPNSFMILAQNERWRRA